MRRARVYRRLMSGDNRPYVIREAELEDAPQLVAHSRSVLAESQWNVTELDEFRGGVAEEEAWILSFHERPHSLLLVADVGVEGQSQIAGLCSFGIQTRRRVRHRGRLGISVQSPYRRLGLGEALLRTLLEWAAADSELERVELSVFAHNTRAIALYKKLGFLEEGRLERAFKLSDGSYYDEVLMVKWVK